MSDNIAHSFKDLELTGAPVPGERSSKRRNGVLMQPGSEAFNDLMGKINGSSKVTMGSIN